MQFLTWLLESLVLFALWRPGKGLQDTNTHNKGLRSHRHQLNIKPFTFTHTLLFPWMKTLTHYLHRAEQDLRLFSYQEKWRWRRSWCPRWHWWLCSCRARTWRWGEWRWSRLRWEWLGSDSRTSERRFRICASEFGAWGSGSRTWCREDIQTLTLRTVASSEVQVYCKFELPLVLQ